MNSTRSVTRRAAALLLILAALAGGALLLGAQVGAQPDPDIPGPPTTTLGVQPELRSGNVHCDDLGFTFSSGDLAGDFTGTESISNGTVTVVSNDGFLIDWTSTVSIQAVIVKGGTNSDVYFYGDPGATADTGLHAPAKADGTLRNISHIEFCTNQVVVRPAPVVEVVKGGDVLSKVGDDVTYTFTITNTGEIPVNLVSISDTLLGDLSGPAIANGCGSLAVGGSCSFSVTRTVQAGDPDPLPNTVTVIYADVEDISNAVNASDSHSVNLFQPSISLTKTGDGLSKVGDPVNYTITLNNTSSADAPALNCTVSDPLLGLNKPVTLASGQADVTDVTYTVQASDPDPLLNTATATCSPTGFPNVLTASDGHSVNLFQPSVTIDKAGDTLSKVGDDVHYTITVENTSSDDSPNLTCDVTDSLLGVLAEDINLAPGAEHVINKSRTVLAGDPDPLPNTARVVCGVDGFNNVVADEDDHSVNLFQPGVTVNKTGDELSKVGDPVDYTITVTNTGSEDSPDLVNGTITDTLLGDLLDPANPFVTASTCTAILATDASCTITATRTVQAGDADPLPNTVTVHYKPDGFPNDITTSDSHEVNLFQPGFTLDKSCPGAAFVGDTITYTITVTNTSSPDSPDLVPDSVIDSLLGDITADFHALGPGDSQAVDVTYTILATDPDPLTNVVTATYHVDRFTNTLTQTDSCTVDISFEGCTPGFWKQSQHLDSWVPTGFSPNQTLESVFDVPDAFGLDNTTLLQALSLKGGSTTKGAAEILLRAAVAALLNSAHPDIDYPRTTADVIADVNAALASNDRSTILALATALDRDNNLGCPLD